MRKHYKWARDSNKWLAEGTNARTHYLEYQKQRNRQRAEATQAEKENKKKAKTA